MSNRIERLTSTTERGTESRDVARLRLEPGQKAEVLKPEGEAKTRSFRMLAYTGAEIARWYGRLAIDLKGIEADEKTAILLEHYDMKPVAVCTDKALAAEGLVLSGHMLTNPTAREICANADEGLPYKCSVGLRLLETKEVAEGAETTLNGRVMKGPITIATRSRLFECSFITCDPADPNTSAEVMSREGKMADLSTAPNATEQFKAEVAKAREEAAAKAREDAKAELAKRSGDLKAAFPDQLEFANDCALRGLTVLEAKAEMHDRSVDELRAKLAKEESEAKAKGMAESAIQKLRGKAPVGRGTTVAKDEVSIVVVERVGVERAKAEWEKNPLARLAFPEPSDLPELTLRGHPIASGFDRFAAYMALEDRLRSPAVKTFGGEEKFVAMLERMSQALAATEIPTAIRERLSSWGKAGPDYADMTVKGFLGMLFRPLEDILGGSWAPRLGVSIQSNQETETYRFFGQVPQFREWLGNRQYAPLKNYSFTATNKTYEASLMVAIVDFLFEKSGQLQMRFGEMGRRAAQFWEKLVTTLITANGNSYDGVAFFATTHTLGGSSGTMSNLLTSADVPALNVAVPTDPTPEEAAKILTGVTTKFFTHLDDKGEPINGDARKFVVMVPTNLWPAFLAAIRLNRLNSGSENLAKVQDVSWDVVCNPRLDANSTSVIYVFREDSAFKPFVLQEATGIEMEFQGAGSALAFEKDSYAFGLKVRRVAQYGEWAHAIKATLS